MVLVLVVITAHTRRMMLHYKLVTLIIYPFLQKHFCEFRQRLHTAPSPGADDGGELPHEPDDPAGGGGAQHDGSIFCSAGERPALVKTGSKRYEPITRNSSICRLHPYDTTKSSWLSYRSTGITPQSKRRKSCCYSCCRAS